MHTPTDHKKLNPIASALRHGTLGLATASLLALSLPATAQTTPATGSSLSSKRSYQIAPGPLAGVLSQFAAHADVVLSFDSALLKGRQSAGLYGSYTVGEGFDVLLAGTPLQLVGSGERSYLLRRKPDSLQADNSAELETVVVNATRRTVKNLDRSMLDNLPAANGDLTSQLKLNPNIQYSESQQSSSNGGEIAPAEISIHGAKAYQNEMMIDGLSIANDLDPGQKTATSNPEYIPGSAQALAIDNSLLCNVRVLDSNVSAEYGRFTGGVVDAELCKARAPLAGSLSVGYTSSDWTKLIIDPERQQAFDNSSSDELQPEFRKWTYKGHLEMRPNEDWGLIASIVRRESDIPLKRFSTDNANQAVSSTVTQTRTNDSMMLKADWTPQGGAHSGDVTFSYAPSSNGYFIENGKDSDYTINSGGVALSGRLQSRLAAATLTQQLSYMENEQSRRSDADYYRAWRWSTAKNWGDNSVSNPSSLEGAWGDIDQTLKTYNYKFKSEFRPFDFAGASHQLSAGVDIKHQQARYERLSETRYWLTAANLPKALSSCTAADGTQDEGCSSTPTQAQGVGQYFRRLITYKTGSVEMEALSGAAYLEDSLRWRDWNLRLGLRADHDSLTRDLNLAPRSSLSWQALDNVSLNVGANRYYGRSLFAYALQEKIHTLQYTQTRNGTLTWGNAVQSLPANRLEDIRSPYDDELTAGITWDSDWLAGPLELRLTRRDGKDQIVQRLVTKQSDCSSSQCYIYTNDGGSLTQDLTLSWNGTQAWQLGGSRTNLWLAFNKSDVQSNYATYSDVYSTAKAEDSIIQYDGKFIRYSEMPADNYNRPWTLRIGSMTEWAAHDLTLTNLLRIRDGYQQILSSGTTDYQGTSVAVWKKTDLPRAVTLDSVINWSPRISGKQRLNLKLTIENVTNRKNKIAVNDSYATYERGRAYTLEAGYRF